jgi:hypothetical protein
MPFYKCGIILSTSSDSPNREIETLVALERKKTPKTNLG